MLRGQAHIYRSQTHQGEIKDSVLRRKNQKYQANFIITIISSTLKQHGR